MSDASELPRFAFVRYAMDRLFAETSPYSATEIAVVLAIVRHMNAETLECWPSYPRISRQTRLSVKTIERTLRRHCEESPLPLLARSFKDHKSYSFNLVREPEAFAKARDAQPKRPRRSRRKPEPKLKEPLVASPRIVPTAARKRLAASGKAKDYTVGPCRCGVNVVTRKGITTNYIDDAVHTCRFTESDQTNCLTCDPADQTKSLTNTGESEIEPSRTHCASAEQPDQTESLGQIGQKVLSATDILTGIGKTKSLTNTLH